jgi:S-formylglutathione hydrolase FrmB
VLVLGAGVVTAAPAVATRAGGTAPQAFAASTTPASRGAPGCPSRNVMTDWRVPDRSARGGQRRVLVFRPDVPDSSTLPVVYLLHGYPGMPEDFTLAGLGTLLDRRLCQGRTPVVVAVPDGNEVGRRDTEWADDAHSGRWYVETFVTRTVVRLVEGQHPRNPAHRALMGFSMGGFGAFSLGLRHHQYGSLVAMDGYFHIDDPDDAFGTHPELHDPHYWLARAQGERVLLMEGRDDADPVTGQDTPRFAAELRSLHVPVSTSYGPGGHDLPYLRSALPQAFGWLDRSWR